MQYRFAVIVGPHSTLHKKRVRNQTFKMTSHSLIKMQKNDDDNKDDYTIDSYNN